MFSLGRLRLDWLQKSTKTTGTDHNYFWRIFSLLLVDLVVKHSGNRGSRIKIRTNVCLLQSMLVKIILSLQLRET
jgi:hypothetical protein